MPKTLAPWLLALAAVATTPAAHAISLFGVQTGGNVVSTDFTTATSLAVDVGFQGDAAVQVSFRVDADDAVNGVSFSSILDELRSTRTLQDLRLTLDQGARFATAGAVLSLEGADVAVAGTLPAASVTLRAAAAGTAEVTVGDALFAGDAPWMLDVAGVAPSQVVTLTISQVPEPASVALMLAGLAAMAGVAGRRRVNPAGRDSA